jgi:hypothetical protein
MNDSMTLKAIDRLVREGRAVHVMIDGKPGIRLIKKEAAAANGEQGIAKRDNAE